MMLNYYPLNKKSTLKLKIACNIPTLLIRLRNSKEKIILNKTRKVRKNICRKEKY